MTGDKTCACIKHIIQVQPLDKDIQQLRFGDLKLSPPPSIYPIPQEPQEHDSPTKL